jgi:hypothetical protein
MLMLEQVLDFIAGYPNVWFATGSDVASYWATREQ